MGAKGWCVHARRWSAALGLLAGGCLPLRGIAPVPWTYDAGTVVVESSLQNVSYQAPADDPAAPAGRPSVVTLPQALDEAVAYNLRLRVGMEKVAAARADLTAASVIPNPTLQLDSQFVPLPGAHPFEQNSGSGPLQYDALVSFPIDWYLFGKRRAAVEAARLGVEVADADFADLVRKHVAATLDTFYDVLEARALLRLFREDLEDLRRLEKITEQQLKLGGAAAIDLDRVRLGVLDAQREVRRREAALLAARAKLRPLLGRALPDPDFDVAGELGVRGTVPVPALGEAIALAEQNRPDIRSDLRDIRRAEAALASEERRGKPQVAFQPGLTYQQTKFITGLPSQRFLDFYLTTTLPTSDRNQGGVARAQSDLRARHATLQADLADLRAEVEQAVEAYRVALALVTGDDPASLKAAREIRDRTEAAYAKGGRRLIEVLDAQRVYRERVRASISAQADYWRALNRLNSALGVRTPPEGPELLPEPKPADGPAAK